MRFKTLSVLIAVAIVWASAAIVSATTTICWHIPDNATDLNGTHMREPWMEISNNPASPTTVTIYQGVYKGNGANQTGGTLFYKGASQGVWQSVGLGFDR